jgi:hypothetical protein
MRTFIGIRLRTTSTYNLGKYLGLPPIIGRGKKEAFLKIKQKIVHKLQGWKRKLLFKEGHEVLIKSVAQAILVYTMSCFKIPHSFCTKINSMASKILVGSKRDGW